MFEEDLEGELNPKKIGEFGKWILNNLMLPDVSIKMTLYSSCSCSGNVKVKNMTYWYSESIHKNDTE